MNGSMGERIWKSMISERLWALRSEGDEAFKQAVRAYYAIAHPGYRVIRAAYPYIYIQDERGANQ
ncbi:hypothetical protein MKX34_17385 [Paenibacillus sp. FSL R5-0636]|uniref:hypothetical protein n=1 Tax=Paenibacillus TaxID=44249 RepID=UPI00096F0D2D|nr:hypothetical protein [Paenibacillus odorifer]OMD03448.1 hypothetical protein BJP49_01135 [Paenibacillus odorifer]